MQNTLVTETIEGQFFEALLRVDGAPNEIDHRIEHFRRRTLEISTDVDTSGRLSLFVGDLGYEIAILTEAFDQWDPVELD